MNRSNAEFNKKTYYAPLKIPDHIRYKGHKRIPKIHMINFKLNLDKEDDREIYDFLQQCDNKSSAIKTLIARYLKLERKLWKKPEGE